MTATFGFPPQNRHFGSGRKFSFVPANRNDLDWDNPALQGGGGERPLLAEADLREVVRTAPSNEEVWAGSGLAGSGRRKKEVADAGVGKTSLRALVVASVWWQGAPGNSGGGLGASTGMADDRTKICKQAQAGRCAGEDVSAVIGHA